MKQPKFIAQYFPAKSFDIFRSMLLLLVLVWTESIALYFLFPPEIPLLYNTTQMENTLVPKIMLSVIPLFATGIALIHTVLISLLKEYDILLLRLFLFSTCIIFCLLLAILTRLGYILLW